MQSKMPDWLHSYIILHVLCKAISQKLRYDDIEIQINVNGIKLYFEEPNLTKFDVLV